MANFGNMMKQAEALQRNMQKAQEEIAAMEIVGESGGGMVKVTLNGDRATVRFLQNYQSDGPSARSRKAVTMQKVQGKWLIQEESGR